MSSIRIKTTFGFEVVAAVTKSGPRTRRHSARKVVERHILCRSSSKLRSATDTPEPRSNAPIAVALSSIAVANQKIAVIVVTVEAFNFAFLLQLEKL